MSHHEQTDFCKRMRAKYPHLFQNAMVLDVGSRDFNGTNAHLFERCVYVACDAKPGPNVSLVSRCHEIQVRNGSFDFIVSTEMLEHDAFRKQSLAKMVDLLREDGHILITCATTGRPVHGTAEYSGGEPYYENVTQEALLEELGPYMKTIELEVRTQAPFDLYYFGLKKF